MTEALLEEAKTNLTHRWNILDPHQVQYELWTSDARFRVVPAGRRSGKTELAKRYLVKKALEFDKADGWFVAAAPTLNQAKRIYWRDLKAMVPKDLVASVSETELMIILVTGTKIQVMGMDKPERIEGDPLDGIIMDEYANMKESAWKDHVRPALSTKGRPGWAWFIGVPEGRNHYHRLWLMALSKHKTAWAGFQWSAEDILDPEEIEALKEDLDPRTYDQEIRGSFLDFEGRAYYAYKHDVHGGEELKYDHRQDLIFTFDFNVSPGTACVLQEQTYTGENAKVARHFTAAIGEVWIPTNSNTLLVCDKLIEDWGEHKGRVIAYGDATGGARGTAKVQGSDWDLIKQKLKEHFGSRFVTRVPKANPAVKTRLNCFNSRLITVDGTIKMLVDTDKCPHLATDLEGVTLLKGSAGEIDKKADPQLTHISDGVGYYLTHRWPIQTGVRIRSTEF